jgi:hypothetical protein
MRYIATNRDLYLAIGELCEQHQSNNLTLERYLLALYSCVQPMRAKTSLTLTEFFKLLADAFTAKPVEFVPAWRTTYGNDEDIGFAAYQAKLIRHIVDLREMDESGQLADEQRYFGIDAPRGARWYNFDPVTYLECGMEGSLGGWEPGDSVNRQLVPGQVAVLNAEGGIDSVNPADIERPLVEIETLSWDDFVEFLECGQQYE